jgi:hypothetical protein
LDPGFKVPSPLAVAAHETATTLTTYCGDPLSAPDLFHTFGKKLVSALSSCFLSKRTVKLQREAMWGQYHSLRSSASFRDDWVHFVQEAVGRTPSPIFFQHVTHEVFKYLIKAEYPIAETNRSSSNKEMTREEENVLRYVAGYVCRNMKAKLESSSLSNKDSLVSCLLDMKSDNEQEDDVSEDWVNAVDRGGLWHVTDLTYSFFYAVEEVVRTLREKKHFHLLTTVSSPWSPQWRKMTMFFFNGPCSQQNDNAPVLLHMIVELYVTIRGFSFASSFVELHKKSSKKSLQKGKGIRKELFTSNV